MPSSEQLATNSPRASKETARTGPARCEAKRFSSPPRESKTRTRPLAVPSARTPPSHAHAHVAASSARRSGREAPRRWYFRIGSGASESESESESEESPDAEEEEEEEEEEDAAESPPSDDPRDPASSSRDDVSPSVSYDDEAEEEEEEGATSSSSPSSLGAGAIAARDDALEGRPANPRRPEARRRLMDCECRAPR